MTKLIPIELGLLKQNLKAMRNNIDLAKDVWNQHCYKMSEKEKEAFIKNLKNYGEVLKEIKKELKKYPHT